MTIIVSSYLNESVKNGIKMSTVADQVFAVEIQ